MEEQSAGFPAISEKWRFAATLDRLAGGDFEKEHQILELSVFRVYLKIQLHSDISAAQNRYQKIISKR